MREAESLMLVARSADCRGRALIRNDEGAGLALDKCGPQSTNQGEGQWSIYVL